MRATALPVHGIGAVVAALLALFALSACSSSSSNAPSGSPGTKSNATAANGNSAAGTATPKSAPSVSAQAGKPIDVCAVVGASAAARLTGQGITTADTQTQLQPQEYGCNYGTDDDSIQVEITVYEHDAAKSYAFYSSASKSPLPVSGLGDKALYDNDGTLLVLSGNDFIVVNGLHSADECEALARPILAAL